MNLDKKMLDKVALNIRGLTIDAIEKANSGHPGMVLGTAEFGAMLFSEILNHNPKKPNWIDRDRFVLSAGHGSMLLYSLLHLTGYDYSIEDIKKFRKLYSKTPGHPEVQFDGIDVSTGPLGQGLGTSVGLALGQKIRAREFNTKEYKVVNGKVFVVAGDGDMMEGLTYESSSFAGHMQLDNLFVFYDSNKITIEGATSITFTEDVKGRFIAQEWDVYEVDGYDYEAIASAYEKALTVEGKPHLFVLNTIIGKYSKSKAGSEKSHGAPLGKEDAKNTKDLLNINEEFYVSKDVYEYFNEKQKHWDLQYSNWKTTFELWSKRYPEKRELWDKIHSDILEDILNEIPFVEDYTKPLATRVGVKNGLKYYSKKMPNLLGGSADLGSSCGSVIECSTVIQAPSYHGKHIQFGIREHAMGAVLNGLSLIGGLKVFGGTFFSFTNYMIPAVRMSALMDLPVNFYFSHDSVYVGEDGPSHQPVEIINQFRSIPNLNVWRPCDVNETMYVMGLGYLSKNKPNMYITSRQAMPVLDRDAMGLESIDNAKRGGYILYKASENPDGIIIATGSEVYNCILAAKELKRKNLNINVVNMTCAEIFDEQDEKYREIVLPKNITKRLAVEASITNFWYKYVGLDGKVIGVDKFGLSGHFSLMTELYGLDVKNIVKTFLELN